MITYPPKKSGIKRHCESLYILFFDIFKSMNKHLSQYLSDEAVPLPRVEVCGYFPENLS